MEQFVVRLAVGRKQSTRRAARGSWRWLATAATIALAIGGTIGCNHVPLDAAAEDVRVIDQSEAANCRHLGSTKVKVLAKVVGFKRSQEKMSKELTTLARNAAVEKQGNAVSPEGEISDGGQKFSIYRCP